MTTTTRRDVDAAQLTLQLRRRSLARRLVVLGILGLVQVWGLAFPARDVGAPGLVVAGVAISVALLALGPVALLVLRRRGGRAAAVAAAAIPLVGPARPFHGCTRDVPVSPRRELLVPCCTLAACAVLTTGFCHDARRAERMAAGHVGTIVTIGVDATYRVEDEGRSTDFPLRTPVGQATAQEHPHAGQRFAVDGGDAYRVGGHYWLYDLAYAAAALAGALAAGRLAVRRGAAELRERRAPGVPLAALPAGSWFRVGDGRPYRLLRRERALRRPAPSAGPCPWPGRGSSRARPAP